MCRQFSCYVIPRTIPVIRLWLLWLFVLTVEYAAERKALQGKYRIYGNLFYRQCCQIGKLTNEILFHLANKNGFGAAYNNMDYFLCHLGGFSFSPMKARLCSSDTPPLSYNEAPFRHALSQSSTLTHKEKLLNKLGNTVRSFFFFVFPYSFILIKCINESMNICQKTACELIG